MPAVGASVVIFEPLGGAFSAENVFPSTIELHQIVAQFEIALAYCARTAYVCLVGREFPELIHSRLC